MTDAAGPPFCEVHGCRGRWDADQPHTLCGKASTTAAGQGCPRGFQSHVICNCKPATAALSARIEGRYGFNDRMAFVWLSDGDNGYRLTMPVDLAEALVERLTRGD